VQKEKLKIKNEAYIFLIFHFAFCIHLPYIGVVIRSFRNITSIALVLLHLAVALAPHIGHAEEAIGAAGAAQLRSHDCGAHEIHKDIKEHNDCLLCSRTTHFVAFVVCGLVPTNDTIKFVASPVTVIPYTYESASPVFLRGPPVLLS
jgi:hypothetical protein